MPKFELHEDGVVYTNGEIGAILVDGDSMWMPFSYFYNGSLDIADGCICRTAQDAYDKAEDIYT